MLSYVLDGLLLYLEWSHEMLSNTWVPPVTDMSG
jgi:hypothetical protein